MNEKFCFLKTWTHSKIFDQIIPLMIKSWFNNRQFLRVCFHFPLTQQLFVFISFVNVSSFTFWLFVSVRWTNSWGLLGWWQHAWNLNCTSVWQCICVLYTSMYVTAKGKTGHSRVGSIAIRCQSVTMATLIMFKKQPPAIFLYIRRRHSLQYPSYLVVCLSIHTSVLLPLSLVFVKKLYLGY